MSSFRRWPDDVANLEIEIVDPEDDGSGPPTPQLLTPDEAAEVCRVSTKTIYRWIKSGDLKAIRLGRIIRITVCEIKRLIAENS